MPPEFSRFLVYDPASKEARPISPGPGEQALPVILATESGSHAMGIFSREPAPGYGRFQFPEHSIVKWNCVFRVRKPEGIPPGDYRYRMFIPVGTLDDVVASLRRLHQLYGERK